MGRVSQTAKEETVVMFVVTHNDAVLGESMPVTVVPGFKEPPQLYDVNFAVEFSFVINERGSMDPVVSAPILSKAHPMLGFLFFSQLSNVDP